MTNLTMAETLLYSTFKLETWNSAGFIGSGTGFYMSFARSDGLVCAVIVTNKHVIEGADRVSALLHVAREGKPTGSLLECHVDISNGSIIYHPDPDVDLCAIPIDGILSKAEAMNMPILVPYIDQKVIPPEEDWQYFDALEEVLMIGSPNGIFDEANGFPIFRRGITASPLFAKHGGKDEFLVDMACFPGSSGSPVFIYDRHGYFDRRSNTYHSGKQRIIFIGVLYKGPMVTNEGEIVFGSLPHVAVSSMMHLGYVIRSTALFAIGAEIRRRLDAADAEALGLAVADKDGNGRAEDADPTK